MSHIERTRPTATRILASILTWALIAGQVMQPVYAVLTNLADSAIAAKVAAKPNIVYTLDDSGSMSLNYVPDYVVSTAPAVAVTKITRVGAVATVQVAATAALFVGQFINIVGAVQPEYNGQFQIVTIPNGTTFTIAVAGAPITPATGTITYTVGSAYCRSGNNTTGCSATIQGNNSFTSPPFFTADFNRMMYNPAVTYYPPLKADGTPVTIAGVTDANGNMGTTIALYAAVQRDVYLKMFAAGVKDNLQTRVSVPLYCNTDWPVTAGVNLAITDVGDLQGGPTSGVPLASPVGAYCRINGTVYGASAASGAPATAVAGVEMGYNYPWQSSSGVKGAQYFLSRRTQPTRFCGATTVRRTGRAPPSSAPAMAAPPCLVAHPSSRPASRTWTRSPAIRWWHRETSRRWRARPIPRRSIALPGTGGSGSNTPGTGGLPECIACNCNNDFLTVGVNGKCSNTGAVCNANYGVAGGNLGQCPNINTVITGCGVGTPVYTKATAVCTAAPAGVLFDPATNAALVPATTLLQDANGNGVVCRHNNQTYAVAGAPLPSAGPGGLFTYPRTNLGDVYPANKTGVPINGYPFSQTGAFTTSVTQRLPDGRHDDRHSAPLLHRRLGAVLRQPEQHGGRPVAGLRHRRMPGGWQERPHAIQEREVWSVPPLGPVRRRVGPQPHLQPGHGLPGRPHLAAGVADACQFRGGQLRQLVRRLRDAPQCREDHVRDRLLLPDAARRRPHRLSRRLPQSRRRVATQWRRHADHLGQREGLGLGAAHRLVQRAVRHHGQQLSRRRRFRPCSASATCSKRAGRRAATRPSIRFPWAPWTRSTRTRPAR